MLKTTVAQKTLQLIRLCMRDTQAPVGNMYVEPEAFIHTYGDLLQQCCQRHIQEYISWNINRHKLRKSRTGIMLLSLLRVEENFTQPKWYEETKGLCLDCPEHIHLNPTVAVSFEGGRYQVSHYCLYANGLPCLFGLRAPPFTSKLKLRQLCGSFRETHYENALQ